MIISTYRRPQFLGELVESIFSQSHAPLEIIVVEGGDADSLLATKSALARWGDFVKIFLLEGSTLGASRNYGAQIASGDWCVFSDDDDLWHPNKLAALSECVGFHDVISHAYHSSSKPNLNEFGILPVRGQPIVRTAYSLFLHFLGNRYGGGSSLSARSITCKAIKFDEAMRSCEDIEWIIRCLFAGMRMGFIQKPLVIYRQHGSRMTGSQYKVARWEVEMLRRFYFIPVGIMFGFVGKIVRVCVRLILSR